MLPKAEGGASVIHADAKLAAREAIAGLDDGHVKIVAQAIETAAGDFPRPAPFATPAPRLDRPDLGTGRPVRRTRRRSQPRRATAASPNPIGLPARSACSARRRPRSRRSRRSMSTSAISTGCGATPRTRAATASPARLAIHPAQVAGHQRGVHADRRRDRQGARDRRGVRGRARRRRGRHRRRDVRPPSPGPREQLLARAAKT